MTITREELDAALRVEPFDPTMTPAEHRAWFDSFALGPLPADATVRETALGGVPALEISVAAAGDGPTFLYFHGGGYVVGSARTRVRLVGDILRRAGGRAVAVDYRPAPEHPFPAAVEDGIAAYEGLLAGGVEPADVVLAGDSAGAGLAVATMLLARDRSLPQPAGAVLFSVWADLTIAGESHVSKADADPIFDHPDAVRWYADHYLGAGDRRNPLASPVFANLSGLPPLLLQVGSHEVLLSDSLLLAANASRDNVDVTLEVVAGVPHVFQTLAGELPEADAALDRVAEFVRHRVHRGATPDLHPGSATAAQIVS
jgi:acetyl esterase/lipase